jgi:hypothetical protein
MIRLTSNLATRADGDTARMTWYFNNDSGASTEYARMDVVATDVTAGSENSEFQFSIMDQGTIRQVFQVSSSAAGVETFDLQGATDFIVADGSITVTDADNASSLSVTNNTITTADALVDIASTSITTGAMARINANTITHDGEILELISAGDATSTPTGLSITIPDVTTGAATGISVVMAGATTSSIGLSVDMAALTTGTGALLTTAGVMTTTGELLSLVANAATTSTGLFRASGTGLTDGFVAELTGGGANATATGGVLNIQAGASTLGAAVNIVSTGAYVGTTGVLAVTATNQTTGDLVVFTGGGAGMTESANILKIDGSGVQTATAIVDIDGSSLTIGAALNISANSVTAISTDGAYESSLNSGTVGAATVTAVEHSDGRNYTTELTLASFVIPAITGAGAEASGALVYTFPAGAHIFSATYHSVAITCPGGNSADQPELGLGSVEATGANATLGAEGATSEDYTDGSTVADCSGTALVLGPVLPNAGIHTGIALNATGDTKTVYLNLADTWAAADTITADGTIVFNWTMLS